MSAIVTGAWSITSVYESTLPNDLISFWKLDEASGTRNDSVGSNNLTDNNTVTQTTGKIGYAAQFTAANSESLSLTDNAGLSTGDIDFTVAAWVYMDSKASNSMSIVTKQGNGNANTEYTLRYEGSGTDRFYFYIGGTAYKHVAATSFGSPSTATWYCLIAWHDSIANAINIQVNNGLVDSASTAGQAVPDTTASFIIGSSESGTPEFWDGRIDAVGFWKRTLTAAERTEFYNAGIGQEYPFPGPDPGDNIVGETGLINGQRYLILPTT